MVLMQAFKSDLYLKSISMTYIGPIYIQTYICKFYFHPPVRGRSEPCQTSQMHIFVHAHEIGVHIFMAIKEAVQVASAT